MKKIVTLPFLLAITLCFFSCKNEKPATEEAAKPVTLESVKVEKKEGDCEPETPESKCAKVSLSYPTVKEGPEALKKAVSDWAQAFVIGIVAFAEEPGNVPSLDAAVEGFINMHKQAVQDMPDMPAFYTAETTDTVLLNDGKHLTLRLDGYSYTGGAHPNSTSAVATWNAATGQLVRLEDLVTNLDTLQKIAEAKFREVKAEVFQPAEEGEPVFEFSPDFPFKLADNTGLTEKGLYFCYVPYEVGPYAWGYTEFVIPFEEISGLMKK